MKKFLVEESGHYKIKVEVKAFNEQNAIDIVYGHLPMCIEVESDDREITEVEE